MVLRENETQKLQGSCEPAKFIELHYGDETIQNPLVLIGKGVTFDS